MFSASDKQPIAPQDLAEGGGHYVIGVAAPVGGGKSTLVAGLADRLADAAVIHFDHYERITEQPIEKIRHWMQNGADLNEMHIPRLAEDLRALKSGHAVIDPLTGAEIPARKYILFETQFGRQHAATGRHIDLMIWIETPLDVALARKIRQFTGAIQGRDQEARTFGPWLHVYLDNYLNVVSGLLRTQRQTVGANADLIVDGELNSETLQSQVEQAVLERFG